MSLPAISLMGLLLGTVPPAPLHPGGAAPVLYVRIAGPAGMRSAFVPAMAPARVFDNPVAVAVRPGYIYQFELTNLPVRPGRRDAVPALYPTLEVRGTVALAPGLNPANFPVPVVFSADEIALAQDGSFFTKVIYCECPEMAVPVATDLDRPVEFDVRPGGDPEAEARARGRIVAIVRFGERQASADELARRWVAGTLLLPGEPVLAPAASPPYLPWACWPVAGPGPSCECLHDGGDEWPRAGIGFGGQLHGLDPADTVAEYTDCSGHRHVTPSNVVCLFAPRFAVARAEVTPSGYRGVLVVAGARNVVPQIVLETRVPPLVAEQNEQVVAVLGRERPSAAQVTEGLVTVDQFAGVTVAVAKMNGASVTGTCAKPPPPEGPLVLCKSADRQAVQVGSIVTFTLKYTNTGGQPMNDVVVSDSLTNRLEYVLGSARSDRDAVFTTRENEAGSVVVRWQIGGLLPPGQTGTLTFQARVR
jgi:uncharacterized repeat protein (TIGR01451 family)